MKSKHVLLALLLSAFQLQAHATTRTYAFTSSIQSMFEHDAQTNVNTNVTQSSLPGSTLAVGDLVVGQFSYDDAALPSPYDENGSSDGYLVFGSAVQSFSVSVASAGFSYLASLGPGGNIVLSDNSTHPSGWDNFSPFSEAAYNLVDYRSANLNLFDKTGTAINGYTLPQSLNLGSFHYSNLHFAYLRKSDGDQFHFNGALTSLTEVSAVPEPATWGLMLTGLALVGAMALRRKQALI